MSTITWKTERRRLGDLKPFEENPRGFTSKQYDDIRKSIDKFDLVEIPAINTDNTLIAGHLRQVIMLAKYGEDHEIDVRVPSRKLSPEEFREYLIRSNKNTGQWELELLDKWFTEEELLQWGFEPWELEGKSSEFDETFDLPDGDRKPFQQVTFTFADEQATLIKEAINEARKDPAFDEIEKFGNENKNGNGLYYIVAQWVKQKA